MEIKIENNYHIYKIHIFQNDGRSGFSICMGS